MIHISLWLIPKDEDAVYLQQIIDDLSQKYDSISFTPHLTVYGNVSIPREKVLPIVKKSIQGIRSFTIKTEKLNYTDDFFKTVFIELKDNKNVNTIYQRLKKGLDMYGNYILNPHISLIYKLLSVEDKTKIIQQLNIKKEFTIDRVVVATPGNKGTDWYDIRGWQVVDTYHL